MGYNVTLVHKDARLAAQLPGLCCTLICTSGTTGPPTPVMNSRGNCTWATRCVIVMLIDVSANELSHVAAWLRHTVYVFLTALRVLLTAEITTRHVCSVRMHLCDVVALVELSAKRKRKATPMDPFPVSKRGVVWHAVSRRPPSCGTCTMSRTRH
jgi:hypothetical protein